VELLWPWATPTPRIRKLPTLQDKGARYAVHTFNAMRQFTHRDSGIVGTVLADDRIFAEIIADGVHVAPEVVRIFAKAKGPSRMLLATDGNQRDRACPTANTHWEPTTFRFAAEYAATKRVG
jgi:N-acetylglucosamine-6-phosphate deacetylase